MEVGINNDQRRLNCYLRKTLIHEFFSFLPRISRGCQREKVLFWWKKSRSINVSCHASLTLSCASNRNNSRIQFHLMVGVMRREMRTCLGYCITKIQACLSLLAPSWAKASNKVDIAFLKQQVNRTYFIAKRFTTWSNFGTFNDFINEGIFTMSARF